MFGCFQSNEILRVYILLKKKKIHSSLFFVKKNYILSRKDVSIWEIPPN